MRDSSAWPVFAVLGPSVRIVGGCVRDALLGREVMDIDMACTLLPQDTQAKLERAGFRVIPTGIEHGTVTVLVNGKPVEITTLRKDVACDGRRAEVEFTQDWEADAARRDFTMNALYADADGKLYDYFDGVEDAKAGHVRFIGDAEARIQEDALRILRFFRFFAHYGKGEMDAAALTACTAQKALIKDLSGERIQQEMLKLLTAPRAFDVLAIMQEKGILEAISLPFNPALAQLKPTDPLLRLACCLFAAPESLKMLADRWSLSNKHRDYLRDILLLPATHMLEWDMADTKRAIRTYGGQIVSDAARIAEAEKPIDGRVFSVIRTTVNEWEVPDFPVQGRDLLELGMKPGKAVGEILKRLEKRWEDSDYELTKEQLLKNLQT